MIDGLSFVLPSAIQAIKDAYDASHLRPEDDVGAERHDLAIVAGLQTQESLLVGLLEGSGAHCWKAHRGECGGPLRACAYGDTLIASCQAHQPEDDAT